MLFCHFQSVCLRSCRSLDKFGHEPVYHLEHVYYYSSMYPSLSDVAALPSIAMRCVLSICNPLQQSKAKITSFSSITSLPNSTRHSATSRQIHFLVRVSLSAILFWALCRSSTREKCSAWSIAHRDVLTFCVHSKTLRTNKRFRNDLGKGYVRVALHTVFRNVSYVKLGLFYLYFGVNLCWNRLYMCVCNHHVVLFLTNLTCCQLFF